jgi:heptosyltransferase-3/putative inorganic carbon (HCO3(-)) transporter
MIDFKRITLPSDLATSRGLEVERHIHGQAIFWKFQSYVLIAVACTSFFPLLFRYQEHAIIILIVLSLAMCAVGRVSPWIRNPLDLPLWLFIAWVLMTVPFATDPAYSFAEWKKFVAQAGVFYWSLLVLHRSREPALPRRIFWSLVLGGTILAGYALIDFVGRGGTWRDRFVRALAYGSDYNWLSTYMVMTIPVIGSLIVMHRVVWIRTTQSVALVVAIAAQVFSYTRGGWVGHAAQAVTLALLVGGRRIVLQVLGFIMLVVAGLFVASQIGIQTDTVAAKTVDTRLKVWGIGLGEIAANPLVGIGYGNNSFIKKFPEYSSNAQAGSPDHERIIPAMHNTFLMVALGSGVPALLFFIWIFIALLRRLVSFVRGAVPNPFATMALGIALAVIGFAVRNLFDYMFMGSLAHVFWILAAVGVAVTGSPTAMPWAAQGDGRTTD